MNSELETLLVILWRYRIHPLTRPEFDPSISTQKDSPPLPNFNTARAKHIPQPRSKGQYRPSVSPGIRVGALTAFLIRPRWHWHPTKHDRMQNLGSSGSSLQAGGHWLPHFVNSSCWVGEILELDSSDFRVCGSKLVFFLSALTPEAHCCSYPGWVDIAATLVRAAESRVNIQMPVCFLSVLVHELIERLPFSPSCLLWLVANGR